MIRQQLNFAEVTHTHSNARTHTHTHTHTLKLHTHARTHTPDVAVSVLGVVKLLVQTIHAYMLYSTFLFKTKNNYVVCGRDR